MSEIFVVRLGSYFKWVEQVLILLILQLPVHAFPLMLLDSYRWHMMVSVIARVNELGVEVQGATFSLRSIFSRILMLRLRMN